MFGKIVYLLAAGVFFTLGVLGAILPGLPTTPFLLLTSYCLVRSSPRLNQALLKSRFFGPFLTDWQERGGVQPRVKVWAIGVVMVSVGVTLYFTTSPVLACVIAGLAIIGIFVIAKLPVVQELEDPGDVSAPPLENFENSAN